MNDIASLCAFGRTQRRRPRSKAFLPVMIIIGADSHRAHLLDISGGGARLHSDAPVRPNILLKLVHDDLEVVGRVVWTRDRNFGIAFARSLPEEAVQMLCKRK